MSGGVLDLTRDSFWTSFSSSAEGTMQFELRDGVLPHVSHWRKMGRVPVTRFAGQARLSAGEIEIKDAQVGFRGRESSS